jgi:hypothetical protein
MRISLVLFRRALSVTESNAAREWIQQFKLKGGLTPPRHADDYEITYSRSSGPGGQNVNKLNTKATVRLDLERASRWLPEHAIEALHDSVGSLTSLNCGCLCREPLLTRGFVLSSLYMPRTVTLSCFLPCVTELKPTIHKIV